VGEKAMIIDFRILDQHCYAKANLLEKFYGDDSQLGYLGLMREAFNHTS
jgi:hypothetical protein